MIYFSCLGYMPLLKHFIFLTLRSLKNVVMASIRDLKKEVDLLMSMVLNDCFYIIEYNPKVDSQAVMKIAGDVITKHREFRIRINHPDGKDNPKLVKKYFHDLALEVVKTANDAFEQLSEEVKKVA